MSLMTLRVVPFNDVPMRRPASKTQLMRSLPLMITLARVPILIGIAAAYMAGSPWTAVALLVVFIAVDIMDGDVARGLHAETATRRLLDGVIDRLGVHAIVALACLSIENLWLVWAFLIVRDSVQAIVGARLLLTERIVVAGATWHRAYTLSIALWGSIVMVFGDAVWPGAVLVVGTGLATLYDYVCQTTGSAAPRTARSFAKFRAGRE